MAVVEDDAIRLNRISGLLAREGMTVKCYTNAEDALHGLVREGPPDLIATDLHLPGIDGWRFCRLLRSPEFAAFNQVPLLVTAEICAGADISKITRDAGADAFLPQPVDGPALIGTVRALLAGEEPCSVCRALVVEQNRALAESLKSSLEAHGYLVYAAATGREAVALLTATACEVVVLDDCLPDMRGAELLAAVGGLPARPVCIVMADDPRPELALEWMKGGAAAYLRKPFDPGFLVELCGKVRREEAQLRKQALLDERSRDLRTSRGFLQAVLDALPAHIVVINSDGVIAAVNDAWRRFARENGLLKANVGEGANYLAVCDKAQGPDSGQAAAFADGVRKVLAGEEERFELEYPCHSPNEERWFVGRVKPLSFAGKAYAVVAHNDITARRLAEDRLRRKSNQQRLLLDTIDIQVWYLTDVETNGMVNRAYADFFNLHPKDVAHRKFAEFFPPDVAEVSKAGNLEVFETGRPLRTEEWVPNGDGERRLLAITRTPKVNEQGTVEYVVCTGADITEQKLEAEETRLFKSIIEASGEAIAISDDEGRLIYANPAYERLFGSPLEEVRLRGYRRHYPPESADIFEREIAPALARGSSWEGELDALDAAGRRFPVWKRADSIRDADGRVRFWFSVTHEISRQKQAEEERLQAERQLRRMEKAESLGRMAGAVAHHFNNMLGIVLGNLDLALEDLPPKSEAGQNVLDARRAARRAVEFSSLMLAYLGQTAIKRETVDLSAACNDFMAVLGEAIPETIRLNTDLPLPGPRIEADLLQLRQIVSSLVINARESIGDGEGHLRVAIREVDARDIPLHQVFPLRWSPVQDRYVCLEVADTGGGIDPATIDKIFDPFFSTKFIGRGLGLAVVVGAVRTHGGAVIVESEPGRGSTFGVLFPVLSSGISASGKADTVDSLPIQTSGKVLVVEDDAMVRDMVQAMLDLLGFEALTAADGVKAIETFRQSRNNIRCVLLNLTMRRTNGWEVMAALRTLRPDIPVIIVSDYEDARVREYEQQEQSLFLQKPYQLAALKEVLGRALGGPSRCEEVCVSQPEDRTADAPQWTL